MIYLVLFQLSQWRMVTNAHILPFSEIVLDPDEVNTSADGSVATTCYF